MTQNMLMNRLPGIVFHTLKGSRGWGHCDFGRLDVARIVSMECRERLFCIFDREKPYTLEVEYYSPKTEMSLAPTSGSGVAFYNETILQQTITKRYASQYMAKQEIAAIQRKQEKLDAMASVLANHIGIDIEDEVKGKIVQRGGEISFFNKDSVARLGALEAKVETLEKELAELHKDLARSTMRRR